MVVQPGGDSAGGTAETSSSAAIAIPTLSNGSKPKWVYVCVITQQGASIVFGDSDIGAATLTNGIGLSAYVDAPIINVAGNSHYRIIGGAASTKYTMTPLAGIFTRA